MMGRQRRGQARLFYEFVTSKESSIRLARDHFRFLARNDIPAQELPAWMQSIRFDPMAIDLAEFDRLQMEWMQHWRDAIRDPDK